MWCTTSSITVAPTHPQALQLTATCRTKCWGSSSWSRSCIATKVTLAIAVCVLQLVKKWRATSFTLRSEGVSSYHKALKSKSYKPDQEVPKPRPVQPSKLDENIVKQGQDALNKLYDNGFIRAKMIRIRLLHYWICKLLGGLRLAMGTAKVLTHIGQYTKINLCSTCNMHSCKGAHCVLFLTARWAAAQEWIG